MNTYDVRYVNFKDVFEGFPGAEDIVFDGTWGDNRLSMQHPYDVLVSFIEYIREVDEIDMHSTINVFSKLDTCIGNELLINFEVR